MNSKLKKLISHLPSNYRKHFTQKSLNLSITLDEFEFKLAESAVEFEQAFEVLYESYIQSGFDNPNSYKKRIIPQFFLPSTAVLIAKVNEKVVGTMSLIRDNSLGLPMESIFDLSLLRQGGSRLTEISSLAIHPDFRKKGGLLLHHFIRYMWNYALDQHGCEKFVIAVNPSMVQLYEDIYLFKKIPQKSIHGSYEFVKGAPAVGLFINTSESKKMFLQEYQTKEISKNLHSFMFDDSYTSAAFNNQNMKYFDISSSSSGTILQYFLDNYPQWWSKLDPMIKFKFVNAQYSIGRDHIKYPDAIIAPNHRNSPRYESLLNTFLSEHNIAGNILNISRDGLKLRKPHQDVILKPQFLKMQIGPETSVNLKLKQMWNNDHFSGYNILDADSEWELFIEYIENKIKTGERNLQKKPFKKNG